MRLTPNATLEDVENVCRIYDIPQGMVPSIHMYFVHRVLSDESFLSRVLVNDLRGAAAKADLLNQPRLWNYVNLMHNEAPWGSWGSVANVEKWLGEK